MAYDMAGADAGAGADSKKWSAGHPNYNTNLIQKINFLKIQI